MDMTIKDIEKEVTERFMPSFKFGSKFTVSVRGSHGDNFWYGCTLKSKLVDQIARDAFYTLTFERADGSPLELRFQVSADELDLNNECTPA
jgi:hypothetical protein